jgi:hypothetical protein
LGGGNKPPGKVEVMTYQEHGEYGHSFRVKSYEYLKQALDCQNLKDSERFFKMSELARAIADRHIGIYRECIGRIYGY